ncbi:MAG: Gfo/Idh/MocA family oxidoreductase [Burkholderiales bacterium]|nr:Gfo/Idh/MocA family oxidoreductase [Burkholderiales bacterium]
MAKLRAAVIGAGHMGRYHAKKLAALAEVELVAVADVDAARAHALGAELGCAAHTDWQRALEGVAAAVIATPADGHYAVARECLARGVHVLVEKPIARSLDEADALIAAARAAGLVLQVGHVQRYDPAYRALTARMDRPLYVEAERLAVFQPRGTDVDVVLDLMIHDIDLALALAASPVAAVSAAGFRVLTQDTDIANARLEFASGCVASLSASRVSRAPVRKLRVFQPGLYVSADLQAGRLRYVREREGRLEESEETYPGADPLAAQAHAFVAAALGRAPVEVPGEAGREALALALAVGRAIAERLARVEGRR